MTQYRVYHNLKTPRDPNIPYVLDVQSPILNRLATRWVIPLVRGEDGEKDIGRIAPVVTVKGERLLLSVPLLGAVPARRLGEEVADLSELRSVIQGAIDFMVAGY